MDMRQALCTAKRKASMARAKVTGGVDRQGAQIRMSMYFIAHLGSVMRNWSDITANHPAMRYM